MNLNSWGKIKKNLTGPHRALARLLALVFLQNAFSAHKRYIFDAKSLLPASSKGETEKYVGRSKPEFEWCLAAEGDEIWAALGKPYPVCDPAAFLSTRAAPGHFVMVEQQVSLSGGVPAKQHAHPAVSAHGLVLGADVLRPLRGQWVCSGEKRERAF